MTYSKEIVREWLDQVAERAKEYPEWVDVFERCYTDTLDNTVEILEDGSTFVLTGDIPAMWLRDSTAQLRPYLHVAKRDPQLRQTIAGLVKRQMTLIHLWTVEQDHKNSPYRFVRDTDRKEDTLVNDGFGPDFAVTGMTWSAFRPSDDCCQYSYLIPSNMFAVVVLGYVQEIFADLNLADSESIIADAKRLQAEIQEGIENYAYTTNSKGEKIYAFEVDGLGNASIMDDPNVPSLLAAPYLGYCAIEDEVYQATRRTILSPENPYFYEGKYASGLGSSHTFYRYIWPIALSIQGLTTTDKAEKKQLLDQLVACDGGTGVMHESFHVDDPTFYSREWFSWANMMFCELVLDYLDIR